MFEDFDAKQLAFCDAILSGSLHDAERIKPHCVVFSGVVRYTAMPEGGRRGDGGMRVGKTSMEITIGTRMRAWSCDAPDCEEVRERLWRSAMSDAAFQKNVLEYRQRWVS